MDKSTQQSLLNTVNQIVNKQAECEDCKYHELAEAIETALNVFEERFSINLTEEQEDCLIDAGIQQLSENKQISTVDLSEQTIELINKYSPEQVFVSILEDIANVPNPSNAKFAGAKATAPKLAKNPTQRTDQNNKPASEDDSEETTADYGKVDDQEQPESTLNPFGIAYQMHQQALSQVQVDPNTRTFNKYIGESAETKQNPLKKHKKKVFKISFMDKGIKKKGTAVSHKGVMRIVSGKSSFKVYDEKNRDVTSLFKQAMKKDKKK